MGLQSQLSQFFNHFYEYLTEKLMYRDVTSIILKLLI